MANREILNLHKEGMLLFEPARAAAEAQRNIYPNLLGEFIPAVYGYNRQLMFAIGVELGKIDPLEGGDFLNRCYPAARMNMDEANQLIKSIASSSLAPVGMELQKTEPDPNDFIRNSTNPAIVVGSTTHAADEILLSSLFEKGIDPATVGMVVFDTHFDGMYPLDKQPFRSSFETPLLQKGIGHLAVIGVPGELCYAYRNGEDLRYHTDRETLAQYENLQDQLALSQPLESRRAALISFLMNQNSGLRHTLVRDLVHRHVVAPHSDRISFIPRETINDRANLQSQLLQVIGKMKANPMIRHLFVSVDIDVLALLEERITATTYSPFASLLAFGMKPVIGDALMDQDDFTEQAFAFPDSDLLSTPPEGMKSSNLIEAISFLKQQTRGLYTFGIPYGAHTFIGSITEMNGRDFEGNTQRVVRRINRALRE